MTSKLSLSEKCHHNLEAVTTGRGDYQHQRPDTVPQKQTTSKLELPKTNKQTNKKSQLDAFREAVDRKTAAPELPETDISNSVAPFYKPVLEAAKMFIPRGRRRDYPY